MALADTRWTPEQAWEWYRAKPWICGFNIVSFHRYSDLRSTQDMVKRMKALGRPVVCTEWMARSLNSRLATHLPMFKEERVGCFCWGLVNGRTQTHIPWAGIKDKVGTAEWFSDLFHLNGRPYSQEEIEVILGMTK